MDTGGMRESVSRKMGARNQPSALRRRRLKSPMVYFPAPLQLRVQVAQRGELAGELGAWWRLYPAPG